MQQRCPNCGSPIAPGQRFCGGCGAQISLACPQCRITVSPGTRFCPNCGAMLGGGMPQQPGWGQQPGGMPPQQPGWGQQPGWAPPAPRAQSSSRRPFLVMLLIVLLIGLGFLTVKYTPLDETLLGFFKGSSTPAVDTTKPVISFKVEPTVGPTSARIDWTTTEPASTQVEYGKTKEQTSLSELLDDPTGGTSAGVITHSVILTGLEPSTTANNITYYYRVKSKDKAGNEAVSDWKSFTTLVPEA